MSRFAFSFYIFLSPLFNREKDLRLLFFCFPYRNDSSKSASSAEAMEPHQEKFLSTGPDAHNLYGFPSQCHLEKHSGEVKGTSVDFERTPAFSTFMFCIPPSSNNL
jgi:hypothetical protein